MESSWGREDARLLAMLRREGRAGITVQAMRDAGVEAPGQAIYMLQLRGYDIDRVSAEPHGRPTPVYRLAASSRVSGRAPASAEDDDEG